MAVTRLDDQNDDLLADYWNVPDPELGARRGLFVAEGRSVVRRLLTASPMTARSVMVTDAAFEAIRDALDLHPALPVYVVPQHVMNGVAGFNLHRGCLALGERPAPRDWRELASRTRCVVTLERIGNADNVGAIFRNAAAFGAGAVLLGPSCADPLYRKAIRTSMGAALSMPFAEVQPWPGGLGELRAASFAIVGLTPAADATVLHEAARALRGRRVAIVLGHEGEGLDAETLEACDQRARIPMAGDVDSVNVATASAIALYELTRR